MRKVALIAVGAGLFFAGTARAAEWVPIAAHHQHRPPARHKFVSHYCETTASPYTGGPVSQVCCAWHPAFASIPDGVGTWDCTFATIPARARRH